MKTATGFVALVGPIVGKDQTIHKWGLPGRSENAMPFPKVVYLEAGESSCFLYRYTVDGEFCGDTWHPTVEQAKEQAAFEYGSALGSWVPVPYETVDGHEYAIGLAKSQRASDGFPPFNSQVRDIVSMLVRRDFAGLVRLSGGIRLSVNELEQAVDDYPATIVDPPPGMELPLDIVEHRGVNPRSWSVNVLLWTKEEGRSDLTLELTIRERDRGGYDVEIDDLHVF